MAQLNDLIVLGNSNLVGETNINGNLNINSDVTIKDTLSVEGTTYLKNNIELTRTSNTNNPYFKLTSSSGSAYLQLVGTSIGIGNGWENSLKIDSSGNATLSGSMTVGGTTIARGASANIIGTTRQATTISNQLVLQKGAVFSGTAANAGLVTRGICGVSTPDANGACNKENLYINYDSTNDYNPGRQVVLQAGQVGTHYGNNLYQYAAARGDAVKGWVESNLGNYYVWIKSTIDSGSSTDGNGNTSSWEGPGNTLGYVVSTTSNTYPNDGQQSGYWYKKIGIMGEVLNNAVPKTRKINNKALTSNITLTAANVGAASKKLYTGTLTTTWTAIAGGFKQSITISGILATDTPVIDIVQTGTVATDKTLVDNWGLVSRITTAANSITAYVYGTRKPSVALPIQLLCIR